MKNKTRKTKSKTTKSMKTKHDAESIREQLLEIISNLSKIPKEKIEKYNSDNFSDLGLDSFSLVEIIFSIENTFDINIPQDSLANIRNFEQLFKLVTELVDKNG